ncbi:hypothetical protein HaLaN_25580 [Haematococcus lacustris]|uniref:Uncharacterized protein n=1 Tax=Haematococcus lacustris TaxID=44745 RepID=A0A6A0A439_HAELA|nr:hypothetical protein HaLaN_25580 [Haematococcus lacustris]
MDSADKMVVCKSGDMVMVFNLLSPNSYTDHKVYAPSRLVVVYAPAEECDKDADLKG